MSKITVDIGMLAIAMESDDGEGEWYLDKVTGEIILFTDYENDEIREKRQQLEENPERFLHIEANASQDAFELMEEFVDSIANESVQKVLFRALNERKPFRRFKDELLNFPEVRQQWFAYKNASEEKIAREWLDANNIQFEEAIKHK